QTGDAGGRQTRSVSGLKAVVIQVVAPAVPRGRTELFRGDGRIAGAAVRHILGLVLLAAAELAPADPFRDVAHLLVGEVCGLRLVAHVAGGERLVDALRRHLFQRGRRRSAIELAVAVLAVIAENGGAVALRGADGLRLLRLSEYAG